MSTIKFRTSTLICCSLLLILGLNGQNPSLAQTKHFNPCDIVDAALCFYAPNSASHFPRSAPSESTTSISTEYLPVICEAVGICYSPTQDIDCDFIFDTPIAYQAATTWNDVDWEFHLSTASQQFVGGSDATFTHQVFRNTGLSPYTWDYGSLHPVGYWYHGSAGYTLGDVFRWEGQAQGDEGLVYGRWKCTVR